MKAGDLLGPDELDALPLRSVVVHDEGPISGQNVLIRVKHGWDWYGIAGRDTGYLDRECRVTAPGPWLVVYVAPPAPARLGDIISAEAQAEALPVGCVIVDPSDPDPESRPAVKVGRNLWMYHQGPDGDVELVEDDHVDGLPSTLVYLPHADSGPVGTAA